jgi:hypothetical protein
MHALGLYGYWVATKTSACVLGCRGSFELLIREHRLTFSILGWCLCMYWGRVLLLPTALTDRLSKENSGCDLKGLTHGHKEA